MLKYTCAIVALIFTVYGQADSSGDHPRNGAGMTPPKVIRKIDPTYSPEARSAGVQGSVLFELFVDENGLPAEIRLLSPLGYGLDERAQEAIQKWRFKPGLRNGKPVKTLANIEVNFRLIGSYYDAEGEQWRTQFNRALSLVNGDP